MSLLSVTADLRAVACALNDIRDLLRRLCEAAERLSPALDPLASTQSTPAYVAQVSDLKTADAQTAEEVSRGRYFWAKEFFGVMPDSEAFEQYLVGYEQEMKRVHGPEYTVDWEAIFRAASTLADN